MRHQRRQASESPRRFLEAESLAPTLRSEEMPSPPTLRSVERSRDSQEYLQEGQEGVASRTEESHDESFFPRTLRAGQVPTKPFPYSQLPHQTLQDPEAPEDSVTRLKETANEVMSQNLEDPKGMEDAPRAQRGSELQAMRRNMEDQAISDAPATIRDTELSNRMKAAEEVEESGDHPRGYGRRIA